MSHPRAAAQRKPGTPLHSVLGGTLRQTFPVTPHGVQTWEKHQRRTNDQNLSHPDGHHVAELYQ